MSKRSLELGTAKLKDMEQYLILSRLVKCKGNRTHTAQSLGIGLRTLQRKLDRYGVPKGTYGKLKLQEVGEDSVNLAQEAINQLGGEMK